MKSDNGVEYCDVCHVSFGSAEKKVKVGPKNVFHADCFLKYLEVVAEKKGKGKAALVHQFAVFTR